MDFSIGIARRHPPRRNWTRLRAALGWPGRLIAARRTMLQLGCMTPSELKDIGLMPQDLHDVSALALGADPTELLARRVRERRRPS